MCRAVCVWEAGVIFESSTALLKPDREIWVPLKGGRRGNWCRGWGEVARVMTQHLGRSGVGHSFIKPRGPRPPSALRPSPRSTLQCAESEPPSTPQQAVSPRRRASEGSPGAVPGLLGDPELPRGAGRLQRWDGDWEPWAELGASGRPERAHPGLDPSAGEFAAPWSCSPDSNDLHLSPLVAPYTIVYFPVRGRSLCLQGGRQRPAGLQPSLPRLPG